MQSFSARAPGRVELLGNHTDYNDGVVLSAAINYAVSVQGERQADAVARVESVLTPEPVEQPIEAMERQTGDRAWANYPFGVVASLRGEGFPLGGFRMSIASDLPAGAGLSSSAALEVATACLLMKLFSLKIEPMRLAKLCRRAENDFVGGEMRTARPDFFYLRAAGERRLSRLPFGTGG